ncbi:MAG: hypothetical protein HKN28_08535 [Alphaproteobacteria bacterium]|nr:hypothetical protein [Alphaproteobacteria bacterium]
MAIRRIAQEHEAKLTSVGAQSVAGKVECKTYGDGERALEAKVRDLGDVAPEYPLQLFLNDALVGELERTRNKAELELDSRDGDPVPSCAAGDRVELRSGELILTSGVFYVD